LKNKKSKNKNPEAAVGTAELAKRLGVPADTIAALAADGVLARTPRGRYALPQSITAYCAHLRKSASGRESPTVIERRRLLKAQADLAVTKARIEAGSLLDARTVGNEWGSTLRRIRSMIMAVPTRVSARLPHLGRHETSEVDYAVRDALMAAARDHTSRDETQPQPEGLKT
jgi:phage terminase Nu1 subunit (DNA packaging protein)